jgi:hypothetical protein
MALSFEELKAIAQEHGFPYTDEELRAAAEAGARYERALPVVEAWAKQQAIDAAKEA